jgi:hypothetical protein
MNKERERVGGRLLYDWGLYKTQTQIWRNNETILLVQGYSNTKVIGLNLREV